MEREGDVHYDSAKKDLTEVWLSWRDYVDYH